MKIRISTVIEVPDDQLIKGREYDSAVQIIFDGITNYVTRRHLLDALEFHEMGRLGNIHSNWGKICGKLEWKYDRVENS